MEDFVCFIIGGVTCLFILKGWEWFKAEFISVEEEVEVEVKKDL